MDTDELIQSLCETYFDRHVAEDRRQRSEWRRGEERVGDQMIAVQGVAEDEHERMLAGDRSRVIQDAKDLLKEAGATLGERELDQLCWELQRTLLRAYRFCNDEWGADLAGRPRQGEGQAAGGGQASSRRGIDGKRVGEAIELFLDRHCGLVADKTAASYRRELGRFAERIGRERALGTITREDVANYRAEIETPGAGTQAPATATVQKAISHVRAFFEYAHKTMEWLDSNPASGQVPKPSRREANQAREPFSDEDLAAIFGEGYERATSGDPARYWLPLVLLYTGARRGEIAQLAVSDIRQVESHWVIDICAGDWKRLKTAESERVIPIHSQLLGLGFLDFLEEARRTEEPRLFPTARPSLNGYGDDVGKWFTRWRRKAGVTDQKKVMHSLRHTFASRLKYANVQEFAISELVGHVNPSMTTGRYGRALDVVRLAEAIEKLDFSRPLCRLFSAREL